MNDNFNFQPLVSAKLLKVEASSNPNGILRGICAYDVKMIWDNGISIVLSVASERSLEAVKNAIGLRLERFEETMPNHATMSVLWLFENGYRCCFNVMGSIQWFRGQ